jgi:hypothetical protein
MMIVLSQPVPRLIVYFGHINVGLEFGGFDLEATRLQSAARRATTTSVGG